MPAKSRRAATVEQQPVIPYVESLKARYSFEEEQAMFLSELESILTLLGFFLLVAVIMAVIYIVSHRRSKQ